MQASRVDWKELGRGRRALVWFLLIGLGLALVGTLVPSSTLGDRIKVALLGAGIVALGVLRPSGFWDHPGMPEARAWRGRVRMIYVALGLLWILAALAGQI